ncbi:porin family protein [Yoonia sp. BS5-3]|uniref:Outer membrane protein n=1 Tax=Yoonia phaeophyticola TaxID=3137369 RepID=A0ABZ2V9I7_9RHOB
MKNYRLHSIILTAIASASTASAGGLSEPIIPVLQAVPPAIVPPNDWYVGAQVGAISADLPFIIVEGPLGTEEASGTLYGLHAGVQRAFGAMKAGVELDYNTTSDVLEADESGATLDLETLMHLKLRAGADVGPAFLYGTAGLAYASGEAETAGFTYELSDTAPFFGIGADVMVSQNISVGGEVLMHQFDDVDDTGLDIEFTTAMLRVSYHF